MIASQMMSDALVRELERDADEELEPDIIDALDRIRSQHREIQFPRELIKKKTMLVIRKYCQTYLELQGLGAKDDESDSEHRDKKQKELEAILKDIFRLLSLCYPQEKIKRAYQNLHSEDKDSKANAIELLDLSIDRDFKSIILPLVEDISTEERMQKCWKFLSRYNLSN